MTTLSQQIATARADYAAAVREDDGSYRAEMKILEIQVELDYLEGVELDQEVQELLSQTEPAPSDRELELINDEIAESRPPAKMKFQTFGGFRQRETNNLGA